MSRLRLIIVSLLLGAPMVHAADPRDADPSVLIDRLAEATNGSIGFNSAAVFLPLEPESSWNAPRLDVLPPFPSSVLRAVVKRGAGVVPLLVAHLDDMRPTRITLEGNGFVEMWRHDVLDANAGAAGPGPKPAEIPARRLKGGEYVVTVGDLCFVALGQIVNRRYEAYIYYGGGFCGNNPSRLYLCSPSRSTALREALKKEWGGLTMERHKASLVADFLTPDSDDRRVGACKRLAYYYPDALEPLALRFLAAPTYSTSGVEKFVRDQLYHADTPQERRELFDAFVAKYGEGGLQGVLLQLFQDLKTLEEWEERNLPAPSDSFSDRPRALLVQLYGKAKGVRAKDRPKVEAISSQVMAAFIDGGLIYDHSTKIDAAVRALLAFVGEDEWLAEACMSRLVGRGFDEDIARYCRRRMDVLEDGREKNRFQARLDQAGWTPLHVAAERGDVDEVRRLLAGNADVNAAAKDGRTALHLAAEGGETEVVQTLLKHDPNLDPRDAKGRTPAEAAAYRGHAPIVLALADRGCDLTDVLSAAVAGRTDVVKRLLREDPEWVTVADANGLSALHLAARGGYARMVAALLEAGAAIDPDAHDSWSPLAYATAGGHLDSMRMLLEYAAKTERGSGQESRNVALIVAYESKNRPAIRLLLDFGADPNLENGHDIGSVLHRVACDGDVEMVRLFLDQGGNIELKNPLGLTPLQLAAEAGQTAVVRLLLARKADVNDKSGAGKTSLHYAARQKYSDVASLLLAAGAEVDAADSEGQTPLWEAVEGESTETLRFLLQHKANPRAAANDGSQPLHNAARMNNALAVTLLLKHGAGVEAKDGDGQTPLNLAAARGHVEAVEALLAGGAAANAADGDGWTPLHWAVRAGSVGAVKALLDHKADPTLRNTSDQTPLDIPPASAESEAEIDRLLKQALPK